PAQRPDVSPAPGNAELVYLRETLYVIKGVYHDPLGDGDKPLPPHRWGLVNDAEGLFAEGNTSDGKGVSAIFRPDTSKSPDSGEWDLWLIPIFDDKAGSEEVARLGEVWIDVDKNAWVRSSSLPSMARIDTRRLLRIPRWSTARKAASGGGFREDCPGAADFK